MVKLLVAKEVYQPEVGIDILPLLVAWCPMVRVQFVAVEERLSAHGAPPVLCLSKRALPAGQGAGLCLLPDVPVGPQRGVVRRGGTTDEDVAFDGEPAELQEVA